MTTPNNEPSLYFVDDLPICVQGEPHWHRHAENPNAWSHHLGHSWVCRVCGYPVDEGCGGSCEQIETEAAT